MPGSLVAVVRKKFDGPCLIVNVGLRRIAQQGRHAGQRCRADVAILPKRPLRLGMRCRWFRADAKDARREDWGVIQSVAFPVDDSCREAAL